MSTTDCPERSPTPVHPTASRVSVREGVHEPAIRHMAFLMAELGSGGIGKMRAHLTRELVHRGIRVDLLLGKARGPYLNAIDERVNVVVLNSSHQLTVLPKLVFYLRREAPEVVVCEKLRVNLAAHRAARLAGASPCILASIHGVLSHKLEMEHLPPRKARKKRRDIARCYPKNSAFIAVSSGIAEDLVSLFGIELERVHVVHNPVVTDDVFDLARESVAHPWLAAKELPVILGVGRLEAQKDFTTLIHAFAIVRRERPCRLLILGEGNERPLLEATVHEVGLSTDVQLLGFVENPYAVMARSDVFVLSSRWEGFGNVLVEAMATGCSLVATDCPSGPREILQDGRLGPLVPPGDPAAMAAAILHSLQNPVDREALVTAARAFTAAACADGYLDVIDRHCHSRFY